MRQKYENELSPRELDVMRLIAKGMTNKEITQEMHITQSTLTSHVVHIYRKYSISGDKAASRVQATLRYLKDKGSLKENI